MATRLIVGIGAVVAADAVAIWLLRRLLVSQLAINTMEVMVVGGSVLAWWLADTFFDQRRSAPGSEAPADADGEPDD